MIMNVEKIKIIIKILITKFAFEKNLFVFDNDSDPSDAIIF